MKREYYIDGEQITRSAFFKHLEHDVYKEWKNEPNDWTWLKDYYGYVKQK